MTSGKGKFGVGPRGGATGTGLGGGNFSLVEGEFGVTSASSLTVGSAAREGAGQTNAIERRNRSAAAEERREVNRGCMGRRKSVDEYLRLGRTGSRLTTQERAEDGEITANPRRGSGV